MIENEVTIAGVYVMALVGIPTNFQPYPHHTNSGPCKGKA